MIRLQPRGSAGMVRTGGLSALVKPRLAIALLSLALAVASAAPLPRAQGAEADPDQLIQLAQRRIRRNPTDAGAYHRLGDAYVQKARASGDPAYFTLAEQALRKSIEIAPERAGGWRHLAHVAASRHDFREALTHARKAIELDPTDADAHGVLGDACIELGRYAEADTAYRKMRELDSSLAAYARTSGLKSLRGDIEGAIEDLELAIKLGRANGSPRESIAWAEWQLGAEHFARGDLAAAEAAFSASQATEPGYYRALAGLAQVRAAHGRFADAVELYRKALAAVPFPEYAAALGDVYAHLGRAADAKKQYDLVEYIGRLNALNQVLYNRELALFYADHDTRLDEALQLARRELEARQDVFAYDLLAWVLLKQGKAQEGLASMTEALKLGTQDARLFFHAGMIHRALGNRDQAREWLGRALALNPHFQVRQAEIARRTLEELTPAR